MWRSPVGAFFTGNGLTIVTSCPLLTSSSMSRCASSWCDLDGVWKIDKILAACVAFKNNNKNNIFRRLISTWFIFKNKKKLSRFVFVLMSLLARQQNVCLTRSTAWANWIGAKRSEHILIAAKRFSRAIYLSFDRVVPTTWYSTNAWSARAHYQWEFFVLFLLITAHAAVLSE